MSSIILLMLMIQAILVIYWILFGEKKHRKMFQDEKSPDKAE